MQAKRRYLLTTLALSLVLFGGYIRLLFGSGSVDRYGYHLSPRSFHTDRDSELDEDVHVSPEQRRQTTRAPGDLLASSKPRHDTECRMETCFDFTRCQNGFKVYVYPITNRISSKYREILRAIKQSNYITEDPSEACIFVPSVDTLDRDKLSKDNYVVDIQSQITALPFWNNGQNHIVFNLYSGTWPDYREREYGFNTGKAMLAQASMSDNIYRPGFDISFPLFHKEHAFSGGEPGFLTSNNVPPVREYTLAFKGKRYLTGIGSETRNSLYHIHNAKDIILLTTCKHGKGWEHMVDERCERDNEEYDKYDYKVLLHRSTFCLVPRGRRLGSYRFLESLQAACIPLILANGWVLPFSEVIDWSRAVVWGDERLLLQVPSVVRSVSHADILALRQQNQFLWDTYFSSIEKIIDTTLEILKDRVSGHLARTSAIWNTFPGAPYVLPEFTYDLARLPFYSAHQGAPPDSFTAVVYARSLSVISSSPIYRLIRNLAKSRHLAKVLILWRCEGSPPTDIRWPVPASVPVVHKQIKTLSARFQPHTEIDTDAVLSLDEDSYLITDEIDFAFRVWQHFPARLVGYVARGHHWDDAAHRWAYSSTWSNDYSMVLTASAFYHRYYGYLFSHWLSSSVRDTVDQSDNCEDILMNFLVSHVSKFPPIKLTQHKYLHELPTLPSDADESALADGNAAPAFASEWFSKEHFVQRHACMNIFQQDFGYMPLIRTSMRLDPLLYKDKVSRKRKKYLQIDVLS